MAIVGRNHCFRAYELPPTLRPARRSVESRLMGHRRRTRSAI
jgi:hypothetical protein